MSLKKTPKQKINSEKPVYTLLNLTPTESCIKYVENKPENDSDLQCLTSLLDQNTKFYPTAVLN